MPTADMPRDERRVTAWIGQGVVIEGRITSAQDLRIDGRVEGAVAVGQYELIVGETATISGDLAARSIVIGGTVTGNVTATERIELRPTASVEGDMKSPQVVMADGAAIKGKMEVGSRT